jgi:hypothetical protein
MGKTDETWLLLTHDENRAVMLEAVDQEPGAFALRHAGADFPYATIATQLKYWRRAAHKLPSYHAVRGLTPPLAYEQASSEAVARFKEIRGERLLDLTLGLGVDARQLSPSFSRVVALEADAVLAELTRYNFGLLGLSGVEIRATTAEAFLEQYAGPRFDWVYADPARRDAEGRRVHDLSAGSPDLVALWPQLQRVGQRLLVKASPLLDLRAAAQLLPGCRRLHVHSLGAEVKEVLIEVDLRAEDLRPAAQVPLRLVLQPGKQRLTYLLDDWTYAPALRPWPEETTYLCEPDPALYQADCLGAWQQQVYPHWPAGLNHRRGLFGATQPPDDWPGRIFRIQDRWPYRPKALRRALQARGLQQLHVLRRHFPLTVAQVRQQLRLAEGEQAYLICTEVGGKKEAILAERCA